MRNDRAVGNFHSYSQMTAKISRRQAAIIVLVCAFISTASGCQVLGIPSYRGPVSASAGRGFGNALGGSLGCAVGGDCTQGTCGDSACASGACTTARHPILSRIAKGARCGTLGNHGRDQLASGSIAEAETYRTGLLPPIPVPGWLADWQAKRDLEEALPEAPEYPRFHPLPTRPMFESQPGTSAMEVGFSPTAMPGDHRVPMPGQDPTIYHQSQVLSQPSYTYGRIPTASQAPGIQEFETITGEAEVSGAQVSDGALPAPM